MTLTWADRIEHFRRVFPDRPNSWPHLQVDEATGRQSIVGEWMFGQDYRNDSDYYGAYPGDYLDRLAALFPEHVIKPDMLPMGGRVLHAFSGSLRPGTYDRCDLVQPAEYQCNVYDLPAVIPLGAEYDLVPADPPYSDEDAAKYKAPPLDRYRATLALGGVTKVGGFVAWLDTVWPMHRKEQLATVGRIYVVRSTNHRVRMLSIFERVDGESRG